MGWHVPCHRGEAVGTKETHTVPREQNPGLVNCTWAGDLSKVFVTSQDPCGSPSDDTRYTQAHLPSQSRPMRTSVPAATSPSLCLVTGHTHRARCQGADIPRAPPPADPRLPCQHLHRGDVLSPCLACGMAHIPFLWFVGDKTGRDFPRPCVAPLHVEQHRFLLARVDGGAVGQPPGPVSLCSLCLVRDP